MQQNFILIISTVQRTSLNLKEPKESKHSIGYLNALIVCKMPKVPFDLFGTVQMSSSFSKTGPCRINIYCRINMKIFYRGQHCFCKIFFFFFTDFVENVPSRLSF